MADADRARRRRWSTRCRSGCSGTSGRPASTRRSRCFRGRGSSSPAPRLGALLRGARRAAERRFHACVRGGRAGADRARLLHGGAAVDLRAVVVLDQFADVLRDPRRRDHGGVRGAVRQWSSWRTGPAWRSRRSSGSAAARCSSTGSTSSWSTATRRGRCAARLPLWGVGVAYAAFTVLMYAAVVAFDNWRLAKPQITLREKVHAV